MILFASQRGRSAELAAHLLNGEQNDHVTVHEISGFVSDDLAGALQEAYAISRGTRCKQFLFSVSLNPPEYADVPIEAFEAAIEEIEKKLALVGQPRIIVFHEKNGRRHCHCVWSRIDADTLTAIRMSHFKRKLMDVSKGLFLKHGWPMPEGMKKGKQRSPLQLTRQEYRQAVRLTEDPRAMKTLFKSLWEQSDSKESFGRALEEQGMLLAKGDRRGYVVLDVKGGIYSLSRWVDIGTRELKARLGPPEELPSLEKARDYLAQRMTENLNRYMAEARAKSAKKRGPVVKELKALVQKQRQMRQLLSQLQEEHWHERTRHRAARIYGGIAGVWQRVTGEYHKIRLRNETEAKADLAEHRKALQALIRAQLKERQKLQKTVRFYKEEQKADAQRLRRDIARYVKTETAPEYPSLTSTAFAVQSAPVPLTEQLARIETRLLDLSGDLSALQASLESNNLSDDMRARIRRVIEKTMETLHLKTMEAKAEEQKVSDKAKDYQARIAEYNACVMRYVELEMKLESENRQKEANRQFMSLIENMSYALNGLPKWEIAVMSPPPHRQLDETAYVQEVVSKRDNTQLIDRIFNAPENESKPSRRPPLDPEMAVPNLRMNVLEVSELLARAGVKPPAGAASRRKPAAKKPQGYAARQNDGRIQRI
ncbi:MAG: relaxase/mobilization nuclease domain-containing protein [Micavibrio sp.]|nr:relaxase/mobilization nuclease domain-containing protein [Micavibrio sp.]